MGNAFRRLFRRSTPQRKSRSTRSNVTRVIHHNYHIHGEQLLASFKQALRPIEDTLATINDHASHIADTLEDMQNKEQCDDNYSDTEPYYDEDEHEREEEEEESKRQRASAYPPGLNELFKRVDEQQLIDIITGPPKSRSSFPAPIGTGTVRKPLSKTTTPQPEYIGKN